MNSDPVHTPCVRSRSAVNVKPKLSCSHGAIVLRTVDGPTSYPCPGCAACGFDTGRADRLRVAFAGRAA